MSSDNDGLGFRGWATIVAVWVLAGVVAFAVAGGVMFIVFG